MAPPRLQLSAASPLVEMLTPSPTPAPMVEPCYAAGQSAFSVSRSTCGHPPPTLLSFCGALDYPTELPPKYEAAEWLGYLDALADRYYEGVYQPALKEAVAFGDYNASAAYSCGRALKQLLCSRYFPRCEATAAGEVIAFSPCRPLCHAIKELGCPAADKFECTSAPCCPGLNTQSCYSDDADTCTGD